MQGLRGGRPEVTPFATATTIAPDIDSLLSAGGDLCEGDVVYKSDGDKVTLRERVAAGGEGAVFELENNDAMVAKLYHPAKLTVGKREKISLMLKRSISEPGICWPQAALYDARHCFRGFLMPRAKGVPLGHGLFLPAWFTQKHPG